MSGSEVILGFAKTVLVFAEDALAHSGALTEDEVTQAEILARALGLSGAGLLAAAEENPGVALVALDAGIAVAAYVGPVAVTALTGTAVGAAIGEVIPAVAIKLVVNGAIAGLTDEGVKALGNLLISQFGPADSSVSPVSISPNFSFDTSTIGSGQNVVTTAQNADGSISAFLYNIPSSMSGSHVGELDLFLNGGLQTVALQSGTWTSQSYNSQTGSFRANLNGPPNGQSGTEIR